MTRLAALVLCVAGCASGGQPSPSAVPATAAAPSVAPTTTAAATPLGGVPLPSGVHPGGDSWGDSAPGSVAQSGDLYLFTCPPDGDPVSVWGTDTYTSDSSVCTAAVHAGLIGFEAGGAVIIEIRPGQETYTGSDRNGVLTRDYGSWGSSFSFVGSAVAAPSPSAGAPATPGGSVVGAHYAQLLTHIPEVIRGSCTEVDPNAAGALAVANCQPEQAIDDPGVVVGDVVYLRYETLLGATQKYAEQLEAVGDQFGEDCRTEASQVGYEVAGVLHGRLLCAPDEIYGGELVAWWYDDRLNVVGSVLLFEGGYEELYEMVLLASLQP